MKQPTQTHISNRLTNKNGLWLLLIVVVIGLHIFLFLIYFVRKDENTDMIKTNRPAKNALTDNISKENNKIHTSPATSGTITVFHDAHTHNIPKDSIKPNADNHQAIPSAMPSMIAISDTNTATSDNTEHTTTNTTSAQLSNDNKNNSNQNEQAVQTTVATTNDTLSDKQIMQNKQKVIANNKSTENSKKDEDDNKTNTHSNSNKKETDKLAKKDGKNLSESQHVANQKEANQKHKTKQSNYHQQTDAQNERYTPEITEQMIKDTQLLSVDLPKSQQQKFVTNNPRIKKLQKKVNHLKKNTETVQTQLSNSIQSVKEINQRKIEKERQLARRAYQDSLKIKEIKKQRQQKPKTQKINKKMKKIQNNNKTVLVVADKTAMNNKATNTVIKESK